MTPAAVELRPTIDRAWLEAAARLDPLTHAFPLWDLTQAPQSVRFVSALDGGRTIAYLLIWLGRPDLPVVHWVGEVDRAAVLAEQLPVPPFAALVPLAAEGRIRARHPLARVSTILMLRRERGGSGAPGVGGPVRRLTLSDTEALRAWCGDSRASERPDFAALNVGEEPVWGAFASGRLVGVCRAAVRLPGIWVVSGVYVDPEARGQALGRRLVGALIEEAERASAPTGLFVREDAGAARRVYASLGFVEAGRRTLIEIPGGRPDERAGSTPGRAERT